MGFAFTASLICAGAFAALFLFTLARGKVTREGRFVLAASAVTAAWALATAWSDALPSLLPVLETAQGLIWLALLEMLLRPQGRDAALPGLRRIAVIAGAIAGACVLADDLLRLTAAGTLATSQIIAREGIAVAGLLLVENLYRNTEHKRLWNVVPLCIGIGSFFAYQLFLYANALLIGHVNPLFAEARPAAACLAAPFLALTLARNRDWRIDIHISRQVVFHTFTLVVSGIFLLAVATLGAVMHEAGGAWGPAAQVISLFGAVLVLALVLSSGGIKARLNYLISRNFFSLRYDYRLEWMNFIDILSERGDRADLRQRVIHAVANIVDSPRGALWLSDGSGYRPAAFFDMRLPAGLAEPADGDFVRGFRGGGWIQELDSGSAAPPWREAADFWLAVPLMHRATMIGFITLSRPRAPLDLNWESYELLRAVSRQAASYICEERAAQELADARGFEEYARRFAFVGHDLKNLASQLRLVAVNARRFGDNPEFRADAFRTIESSVTRMNRLLTQLKASGDAPAPTISSAALLIAEVVGAHKNGGIAIQTRLEASEARVAIAADDLRSALSHLVSNAIEASPDGAAVTVGNRVADGKCIIEIVDQGPGMAPEFIHRELFRPFRTTKDGGYGIGAYQTRELIRAAGGELDVVSQPGAGTTMRIVLPLASEGAVSSAA
ncbi:MAG TPA: XrtA/PEP-CTERM system histidine kinase PrsK [Stellaceae bacterium]|nr:XrtA/PEP-CTERM system histidine kinase PrsK [Stellaceae bacterium]